MTAGHFWNAKDTLGSLPSVHAAARSPQIALRRHLGKSLGVRVYSIHTLDHQPEKRRGFMERAIELMAAGRLKPPPPMLLPLRDARKAHELMEAASTLGKVVLIP